MPSPGISVVIATKGRVKLLDELLESLAIARKMYPGGSEVILVDDSSPDDRSEIVESCARHDARMVDFGPSVSAKRNRGVEESRYEIVLLLDSDCLATPGLLVEHARIYEDPSVGAVAGLLEFVGPDTWFWKAVAGSQFVVCFDFPRWMPSVPWTPTANCSMRRDVFLEHGGFDSDFPDKPGGEDVDLGLRVTRAGWEMRCNPKALVYHQKKTWIPVGAMVRRLWNYGSADCYLMERHRDLLLPCYPRQTVLAAMAAALAAVAAIAAQSPAPLLVPPIYLVGDILMVSLCMQRYESGNVSFLQQCVIQLLIIDNELGFVWRCLQRREPRLIGCQLVYFDGQATGIQERGSLCMMARLFLLFASIGVLLSMLAGS